MVWRNSRGMSIQLLNGDCYELIRQIPDKSIDLVYTDVPYLYFNGGRGSSQLGQRMGRKKEYLSSIDKGFDYNLLAEFIRVCKNPYIYIWCSKLQLRDILNYMEPYNLLFELLVWCKTNPSPTTNQTFLPDVEYCLLFREPKTTKLNDGYFLKSKWYGSAINKKDKDKYQHPTIKPLELVERHIMHSTQVGDTVLDCFMGSGTTGVACKLLGRNFIGMEIEKEYFQIAQARISEADSSLNRRLF